MGLKPLVTLLGLSSLLGTTLGAIHPYNKEYFYAVGDAFIFRGGREGLYASTKEASPGILRNIVIKKGADGQHLFSGILR